MPLLCRAEGQNGMVFGLCVMALAFTLIFGFLLTILLILSAHLFKIKITVLNAIIIVAVTSLVFLFAISSFIFL